MTDWSKLGRTNKNRGKAFERKVASKLGWTRVPYSGSHRDWGKGDVFDGTLRHGFWLAECKTQPLNTRSLTVKNDWIEQAEKAIVGTKRNALIPIQQKGQQDAWVFLPQATWDWLADRLDFDPLPVINTIRRGRGRGFGVRWDQMTDAPIHEIHVKIGHETEIWRLLELNEFAHLIQTNGLMIPRPVNESQDL